MDPAQSELVALVDSRSQAIQRLDIDRLLAHYAPDIVYFDVVPPLQYTGVDALRHRFLDWFQRWTTGIGQEVRELTLAAGGDIATAHMLIRTSGTLRDGREVGYWVRGSNAFRRSDHGWLITHEHVSLPVEMPSGVASLDLEP